MRLNKGIPTLNKIPKGYHNPVSFGIRLQGRHPGSGVQQGPTGFSNQASGFRDHCSYNSKFYCFTFLFF
jgi:hypothetical protein